ncbi:phospholipid binding protein [Gigaspora margarita]|uniref:Phospholipid binding protein n=2 Tax=Gigaspora margarita TaxID=4874 RepID=A0A8H3WZM1_GIGMA|nr:phospholipid binding protein [Gigaspora margarita]
METVYAIHNYCAQNDDELTFKVGDPILVLEKDEMYWDGWWQGQDILGQTGLFPMNYTSYEKPATNSSYDNDNNNNNKNMNKTNSVELIKNNDGELITIPQARMPNPSANQTIADIQNKLHTKKQQSIEKINSESKSDSSICETNSVPNLPIQRTPPVIQLQKQLQRQSQRQSKGSLKNGRSSVSSSGSNHSESLSSPSRQNTDNIKVLDYSSKPNNNLQSNPLTWNVEQVCQWLKEKGFDSVIEHFIENDITGDILLGLDLDSLKELNIMSYGKRVHIMNAIKVLKESSVLNQDQGNSLQPHPIMESTSKSIKQSKSIDILDKVDVRPESSYVKSNEHTSWPQQINNTNEKIQTITGKTHKKKSSRIFSKLNFTNKGDKHNNKSEKHETIFSFNTKPAKKDKSQSISSEGWEFLVEEDYGKKHKNKSKNLSRKISKEYLDRNSLVGSQLGLPKYSIKNEHNRLHSVDESIGENEETLKNLGTPDYEGWLMKQDDKNKSWKNRFCVLKEQTLYYFQNDKMVQTLRVKGSINITGYRVIPDENILQGKYGFKLVHDIERPYYFAHENLGKMREWMKAIMKATISRDPTSPVFSSSELNTMSLAEARKLVHKKSELTNKSLQSSNGTDSSTLERSLSPTFYSTYLPSNSSFNRPNPQHSSRCRSVSPLPEMSGQPVTMTFSKSKSSAFKKLIKSTSFDSITINYM